MSTEETTPVDHWERQLLRVRDFAVDVLKADVPTQVAAWLHVVSKHWSSGIALPVVRLQLKLPSNRFVSFTIRDNFYDVNVWVQLLPDMPCTLSPVVFYQLKTFEWYEAEMARKRNYCFTGWTDAEVDDPRVLRVEIRNLHGTAMWREVSGAEKDRWLNRYHDTSWYKKDWSSARLIPTTGAPFGATTEFWYVPTCFAEGIEDLWANSPPSDYKEKSCEFIFCKPNWADAAKAIEAVYVQALENAENLSPME